MAVPSAVLRQREKLEAELGIKADGTPLTPPTPPADPALSLVPPATHEPTPTTPATPAVTPTPDAAQARIAELEHLLKTRDGQTSSATRERNEALARADATAMQVKALEEAVAELTRRAETAEAAAIARRADEEFPSIEDPGDLTPEELNVFGADSAKFVQKLSKKELLAYIKPLVTKIGAMEKSLARLSDLDKLPQLEKVVKSSQEEAARLKEEEFFRTEILSHFPDFETVRDSQDWKDYLSADLPGKGIKVGHLLHQYRMMHNAQGIRSVLQAYYDQKQAKPSLSALAVPGKAQTEGTPVVKPKMKASEYKQKLKDFIQKKLPQAQWDTFKTEFETAMQEGRVDMDERL